MDKDKKEVKVEPRLITKTNEETKPACGCGCTPIYRNEDSRPEKES